MSYGKIRKDFEYLESIRELDDWVEIQGDMEALMREPTKANAADYYLSCIGLWMQEAKLDHEKLTRRAESIAKRYGL